MRKKRRHKPKNTRKGEHLTGLSVKVYNNNVEFALKKFKNKIKKSGLMLELKKRSYFKKPSEDRREKKNMAICREKYKNQKESSNF